MPRSEKSTIPCKWVFRVKSKIDGTIDRYKARLVAKGFLQKPRFEKSTIPDILFVVNKLSQFLHAPRTTHWQVAKRVLRYLKGTLSHGLFLRYDVPFTLTTFSDSDWGGVRDDGRSTTTYVIYFGSNVISWIAVKQKTVSRSSTEAEYRALADTAAEFLWIQNLLSELGIFLKQSPLLLCDNLGATYVCKNPVFLSRMKHLGLDYFLFGNVLSMALYVFVIFVPKIKLLMF